MTGRERWREGMKISHVCTYVLMLCGGEGEVGEGGIEKGGDEEGEVVGRRWWYGMFLHMEQLSI